MSKKILFISHDTSRTGAPMVLLYLMSWISKHTDYRCEIIALRGGDLEPEFKKIAKTFILESSKKSGVFYFFKKFLVKVVKVDFEHILKKKLLKKIGHVNPDLIYANTANTAKIIAGMGALKSIPVILHLHELKSSMERSGAKRYLPEADKFITKYIACSRIVKDNIVENIGVDASRVETIYEFVEPQSVKLSKEEVKKEMGLAPDTIIVAGVGSMHWRKGVDFFLFTARKVILQNPDKKIVFVWLGGDLTSREAMLYNFDIEAWGLTDKIRLLGSKPNPWDYINAIDVLAMTSREDPFPLVCIEAAMLAKPIVCFNKNVGSAEFIDNQVMFLDIDMMSAHLEELINDPDLRTIQGEELKRKTATYTLEETAPRVLEVINGLINLS